jgi:hypothetical protein
MRKESISIQKKLFDRPGHYQIRVQGKLGERWLDYLDGLEITTTSWGHFSDVTEINGWLADQTALAGLLDLLTDLGNVILTVERLEQPEELK